MGTDNIKKIIKEYSFSEIIRKVRRKFLVQFGFKYTDTIFFVYQQEKESSDAVHEGVSVTELSVEQIPGLKKINIFKDLDLEEVINSPNHNVLIAEMDGIICGFIIVHFGGKEVKHNLNGWLYFKLNQNEAWVGPTYVGKDYRGKGLNTLLLQSVKKLCYDRSIELIFTSINSENIGSINSFRKNKFISIGSIRKQGKNIQPIKFSSAYLCKIERV